MSTSEQVGNEVTPELLWLEDLTRRVARLEQQCQDRHDTQHRRMDSLDNNVGAALQAHTEQALQAHAASERVLQQLQAGKVVSRRVLVRDEAGAVVGAVEMAPE